MVRKVMRLPAVLAATGWAKPTLYNKIADGKFPKGTKLDTMLAPWSGSRMR